jgi:hypothetical protein
MTSGLLASGVEYWQLDHRSQIPDGKVSHLRGARGVGKIPGSVDDLVKLGHDDVIKQGNHTIAAKGLYCWPRMIHIIFSGSGCRDI